MNNQSLKDRIDSFPRRLINATTYKLEEFLESRPPSYAIVSHTWGKDEIELRDFTDDPPNPSNLYRFHKIRVACEKAKKSNLSYIWIDSCCIDKTNMAELEVALQNMFQWYRNATICFAYLSDISMDGPQSPRFQWHLGKCRWFTRGWTLQELLAPPEVVFFNMDWFMIGTRYLLRETLEDITGIDSSYMDPKWLPDLLAETPAAKIMSWMSKRETTRPEDMAYSLQGLLNVQMPICYGEGGKSAFYRLQTEVLSRYGDISLFAWWSPKADRLPYGYSLFTGSPRNFLNCGRYRMAESWSPLEIISPPKDGIIEMVVEGVFRDEGRFGTVIFGRFEDEAHFYIDIESPHGKEDERVYYRTHSRLRPDLAKSVVRSRRRIKAVLYSAELDGPRLEDTKPENTKPEDTKPDDMRLEE
jgi:hypothetical protein